MMQVTIWFEDLITHVRHNILVTHRFYVSGIPVAPVGSFAIRSLDGQNILSWRNPVESRHTGTLIRCRTDRYPAGPTDGVLVVDKPGSPGANETYAHTGLTNGVTYYYTAWAHDGGPVYSAPRYACGIPTPSVCFEDTFSYPNGNLNGNGSWSGTATNQIQVSGHAVKVNGDPVSHYSVASATCSGGASGIIWVRAKIRQGIGNKTIWSFRVNDNSGVNLARWYGTGTTARPRIGDSTSVLAPQILSGPDVWDTIEVRIHTATDTSEFLFNGTTIGTLSHVGAGNTVGEVKIEVIGNTDTNGRYVYLDDLVISEFDITPPGPVTSFRAAPEDGQINLSWANPTDADYAGTKIVCKTTGYPTSVTDGVVIYDGTDTSYTHRTDEWSQILLLRVHARRRRQLLSGGQCKNDSSRGGDDRPVQGSP
jgi:hypothetical protein